MGIDQITQRTIYYHLEKIQELFKKSHVTLYIRSPDVPDGDVFVSDEPSYDYMLGKLHVFIKEKEPKGHDPRNPHGVAT